MLAVETGLSVLLSWGDQGFGDELFWAALRTLEIAMMGYLLGLAIGLLGANGKLAGPLWLRHGLVAYTTIFRALPELILIMLLYYAGTGALNKLLAALGLGAVELGGFAAAVLVLGIVQGAYSTEVLRAAILAVPRGQLEAAQSLGMPPLMSFNRIMLPAMLPNAVPGMANLWLNITKDSALISIVGFGELALVTQQVAGATRRYFVIYLISQLIYLLISQISLAGFGAVERRLRRGQALPMAVH